MEAPEVSADAAVKSVFLSRNLFTLLLTDFGKSLTYQLLRW